MFYLPSDLKVRLEETLRLSVFAQLSLFVLPAGVLEVLVHGGEPKVQL